MNVSIYEVSKKQFAMSEWELLLINKIGIYKFYTVIQHEKPIKLSTNCTIDMHTNTSPPINNQSKNKNLSN